VDEGGIILKEPLEDFRDRAMKERVWPVIKGKYKGNMHLNKFLDEIDALENEYPNLNLLFRPDGLPGKSFKQVKIELMDYYKESYKKDKELLKLGVIRKRTSLIKYFEDEDGVPFQVHPGSGM